MKKALIVIIAIIVIVAICVGVYFLTNGSKETNSPAENGVNTAEDSSENTIKLEYEGKDMTPGAVFSRDIFGEELTYSENAIIMGLTRNNKEFSKDTLLMFYETLEEIESLGIDLTPNPVKPQNSIIKREVNTESEPVPNKNVALLAEAFYETTENDRSKLMAEIIDLGHRSQPTSENKNIESKKEER